MMILDVNKAELTIMGVPFDNKKDFQRVLHTLSTNIFEGWEPNQSDILHLKKKAEALRAETHICPERESMQ